MMQVIQINLKGGMLYMENKVMETQEEFGKRYT